MATADMKFRRNAVCASQMECRCRQAPTSSSHRHSQILGGRRIRPTCRGSESKRGLAPARHRSRARSGVAHWTPAANVLPDAATQLVTESRFLLCARRRWMCGGEFGQAHQRAGGAIGGGTGTGAVTPRRHRDGKINNAQQLCTTATS